MNPKSQSQSRGFQDLFLTPGPDLSVLDFSIWHNLKEAARKEADGPFYKDKAEAEKCLKKAWAKLPQEQIDTV